MVKGAYEKYYTEMSPEALLKKEHLEPDEEAVIDSMADEAGWPAPGSADTELGVLMEPEVGHGETEVYTRVQA